MLANNLIEEPIRVMVERLFSDAKHIMTEDRRHIMDSSALEI